MKVLIPNIGFSYIFEVFVLAFLNAYKYKPNIMKKSMVDNIVGAILSQAIYIPIMATFISLHKHGLGWKLGITLYYVIVERIFLRLKIFKTYWWKTRYTAFFLPVAFYLSDYWSNKLTEKNKVVGTASTYLTLNVFQSNLLITLAMLKKSRFKRKWKRLTLQEHIKVGSTYALFIPALYTFSGIKQSKFMITGVLLLLTGIDFSLIRLNMLNSKNWFLTYFPMHILLLLLSKHIAKIYTPKVVQIRKGASALLTSDVLAPAGTRRNYSENTH